MLGSYWSGLCTAERCPSLTSACGNVWKEPLYDVILTRDPEATQSGWEAGRRHYFEINWILGRGDLDVFGLFLAALMLL